MVPKQEMLFKGSMMIITDLLFGHDRCPFMVFFFRTLNPNPSSECFDHLIWLGIKFRPPWPRTLKLAIKGLILALEGPKFISDIVEGQVCGLYLNRGHKWFFETSLMHLSHFSR